MFRLIIGAVIGVALFASVSQAEDKAPTAAETLTAIGNGIQQAPAKIQTWASSEWEEIKLYQAQGWADGKAQLNQNWQTIRGFFKTTESTN